MPIYLTLICLVLISPVGKWRPSYFGMLTSQGLIFLVPSWVEAVSWRRNSLILISSTGMSHRKAVLISQERTSKEQT
jgi:hypothetical protein